MHADSNDRATMVELFAMYGDDKNRIPSDPLFAELPSGLAETTRDFVTAPKRAGPTSLSEISFRLSNTLSTCFVVGDCKRLVICRPTRGRSKFR